MWTKKNDRNNWKAPLWPLNSLKKLNAVKWYLCSPHRKSTQMKKKWNQYFQFVYVNMNANTVQFFRRSFEPNEFKKCNMNCFCSCIYHSANQPKLTDSHEL